MLPARGGTPCPPRTARHVLSLLTLYRTDSSQKYNEAAKRATEKYKSDYKRYYESLPAGAAEDLGLTAPGTKSLSASARNAAARKARGEPAKPQGSFFVFLHDFRKSDELRQMMERDGVENGAAVYTAKKAGEKWAVMSEEEKQVSCRLR